MDFVGLPGSGIELRLMIGPCSTERRWLTLKPNSDDSPFYRPTGWLNDLGDDWPIGPGD